MNWGPLNISDEEKAIWLAEFETWNGKNE